MNQRIRILLLEDNDFDAEIIYRVVKNEWPSCQWLHVVDGAGFMAALNDFKPDVILSDNDLPSFSGTEALKMAKQRAPLIPFILVTGTVSEVFAIDMLNTGADDYILKDRLTRLPSAIQTVLKFFETETEKKEMLKKLTASELQYRELVERITDGFMAVDSSGSVTYANAVAESFFEVSHDGMLGRRLGDVLGIIDLSDFTCDVEDPLTPGKPPVKEVCCNLLNRWLWVNCYSSSTGGSIVLKDITKQRAAEMTARRIEFIHKEQEIKIRDMHMRMTTILNSLPAHIVMVDPEGKILEANNSWYGFAKDIGLQEQQAWPGNNLFEIKSRFLPSDENGVTTMEKTIHSMLAGDLNKYEYDFHFINLMRWYHLTVVKLEVDHTDGAVVIFTDITQLKKMEAERISRDAAEQKKITTAVLDAQEKERDFIGSELHDNINQQLVGIQLALAGIRTKVNNDQGVVQLCLQNIKQVIVETRKLAHELVTPDFNQQSLRYLVEEVLAGMLSAAGIRVTIKPESFKEVLLTPQQKIVVYRIVQEQCINILKHAKATAVEIMLQIESRRCFLIVRDNGIGMDPSANPTGIGMRNIRARLTLISGSLQTISFPGRGFTLTAEFPIHAGNLPIER